MDRSAHVTSIEAVRALRVALLNFEADARDAVSMLVLEVRRAIFFDTPLMASLGGLTGFYLGLKRRFEASKSEAVQALFVFLLVSFVVLTIVGVWFRGEGMKLVWLF